MTPFVEQLNFFVALGTIVMQAAALFLFFAYALRKKMQFFDSVVRIVGRRGIPAAFAIFTLALVLSLYYSEVLGFEPCGWCWAQRIFVYAQVVLFAVALYKRDSGIADYSIALSLVGAVAALYQHYLQMGGAALLPCPSAGGDCAQRILFEFDYITFPLVGFSVLALGIALMLCVRIRTAEKKI